MNNYLSILSFLCLFYILVQVNTTKTAIQCCTIIHEPITEIENKEELIGLSKEYLAQLEGDSELNLTCKEQKWVLNFSKGESTGIGHTQFIYGMGNCSEGTQPEQEQNYNICKCQLGVGGWLQNEDRYGKVEFLPPFVFSSFRVVVARNSTFIGEKGLYFLSAFSLDVWLLIFGLLIVFTILKMLDKRFMPPDNDFTPLPSNLSLIRQALHYLSKSPFFRRLRKAIMNTFKLIIGQTPDPTEGSSPSTRHWLLNYAILLCGLFFVLTYEAAMTANLVQQTIQSEYDSIDDFKQCRIPASEVCLTVGGAVQAFWESAIVPNCKNCNCRSVVERTSYAHATQTLLEGGCKYMFAEEMTAKEVTNRRHCKNLIMTGEPTAPNGMSFILPRNSNLTRNLTLATFRLINENKLQSVDDYLRKNGRCKDHGSPNSGTLTLTEMKSFFICAYITCVFILVLMIFDPYRWREGESQNPSQNLDGDDDDQNVFQ